MIDKDKIRTKYCFFDVDGVLNKESMWKMPYSLDRGMVKTFCEMLLESHMTAVITSSWRIGFEAPGDKQNTPQIQNLERLFQEYGVSIAAKTPILRGRSRDVEVERFLYYHPCDKYVILDDDMNEFSKTDEHNYFTKSSEGLTAKDAKNISKLLK